MKPVKHSLKIQGSDDLLELKYFPEKGRCHIMAQLREEVMAAQATDYFEAFCQIRIKLECRGLIPICNGSSLDVYPSGMCKDMGAGLSAYRFYSDRMPKMDDLLEIFEVDEPLMPSTVAEQKKYHWASTAAERKRYVEEWERVRNASTTKKWWQFWR